MRRVLVVLLPVMLALGLGACAKRGAEPAADTTGEQTSGDVAASGETVTLRTPIPFAASAEVRQAVRDECQLQEKLAGFIQQFAAEQDIAVNTSSEPTSAIDGRVLSVAITNVYAPAGGAYSGGKAVTIEAELTENGRAIGDLTARRISGGGAFAVFKGTCDILGRDVETLGADTARFLQSPGPDMRMGNL